MRKPAEVFSPGSFIDEELDARGLGEYLMATPRFLAGEVPITRSIEKELTVLFAGTDPRFWRNLQAAWDRRHR